MQSRTGKLRGTVLALIPAAMLFANGTEVAVARPDTRTMTCAYAQAFVQQHRAVVMTTGQYTYVRFVAGMGLCGPQEHTRLWTAPTLDYPKCRVAYICETNKFD